MDNLSVIDLLFFINFAWLATHELDAIKHHEWRIFFYSLPLADVTAYRIFTLVHVPLFALIIWAGQSVAFQAVFSIFLIIHVGLHYYFRKHPAYEFNNWFSNLLIIGGAPLGGLHLLALAI